MTVEENNYKQMDWVKKSHMAVPVMGDAVVESLDIKNTEVQIKKLNKSD